MRCLGGCQLAGGVTSLVCVMISRSIKISPLRGCVRSQYQSVWCPFGLEIDLCPVSSDKLL